MNALHPAATPRVALATLVLACLAAPAAAQVNLGFETADSLGGPAGWATRGAAARLDSAGAAEGRYSLRLDADGGAGMALQTVPATALAGRAGATRLRLRGRLRTEALDGVASVWVRADGPGGPVAFDNLWAQRLSGTTDWTDREATIVLPPEATRLVFGALVIGDGTAYADAFSLDALAPETDAPAGSEAADFLARILDLARTQALRRDSVDWSTVQASVSDLARGARTTADAYPVARYILTALGDRHSRLLTPADAAATREAVPDVWPAGEPLALADGQTAGYLYVPGMSGSEAARQIYADTLQAAIRRLDAGAPCGYVVDLRDNPGGDAFPMVAGLRPLFGDGSRGASVYADGRTEPWTYGDDVPDDTVFVRPRHPVALRTPDPPVAVLTGPETASSGELVAVSFRGRPRTRSFGDATEGVSTANDWIDLPDGSVLLLTVAAYADRTGTVYGGRIAPDEPVETGPPAATLADDAVVRAALAWLAAECRP